MGEEKETRSLDSGSFFVLKIPRLVVSAQKGGAGKTVFTLGLVASLRDRGLKVAPFKKGPDYIDAGWLQVVSGRPCRNLDPFLMEDTSILALFRHGVLGADIAVIEGNRGLYDGVDVEGSCSTARLAKLLNAPVILVLDCTKVTRSLAATLLGFLNFEDVDIRGVILNRIARARHEAIITKCIERYTGVPVLGVVPKLRWLLKERHLGLIPWQEFSEKEEAISRLVEVFKESVDVDRVFEVAESAGELKVSKEARIWPEVEELEGVRVGVIRDRAFQFYYPENLEALEENGAELVELDAVNFKRLPDVDLLYIGGGFPETQAEALSANKDFMKDVKEAAEGGLPVYAECGGLMYLGAWVKWRGEKYPMCGVLPIGFDVKEVPQGHGYTVVRVIKENPYYEVSTLVHGHEFHYSLPRVLGDVEFVFEVERGFGFDGRYDGVVYKKVFGTYTHVHVANTPQWLEGLVRALRSGHRPLDGRGFRSFKNLKEEGEYVRDHDQL